MDERKLNGALFAQMCAEQQDYRAWLMTLPPDEILDHAAEFAVREDILVELEAFDLPADQAAALLASPTSLADIYREWGVIENCAEDMADRSRDRPSVLEGLKRPAQPGPERKAPKSPSQER